MTRCEAYLDSKGFLRWWSQGGDGARATRRSPRPTQLSGAPVRA